MNQSITEAEQRAITAEDLPAFRGFKLLNLKTQISEILTQFGRNGLFEEYTKHDISHLKSMLTIYNWLIPESSKEALSPADWLLLVCSTYLHDLGLVVTKAEYANRMNTAYAEYREAALDTDDVASRDYKAYLKTLREDELDRFLYQEFVRANHAARIRSWLQAKPDQQLGYDQELGKELKSLLAGLEPVFVTDIGTVCESHHLDDLQDTTRYLTSQPYGNSEDETANVQYAAICLRAADLLHITRDRTPSIAFKLINPNNPDSQREWAKQNAVRSIRPTLGRNRDGDPDPTVPRDTIEVHAKFDDEEGFFGLTAYLKYAEKQLRQCHAWASYSNRKNATQVTFPWRHIDLSHIEASGFIAQQFEFKIDEGKILDLLTGHTLYNDSSVVVRETVQNALDAVRLQTLLSRCACVPQVKVRWSTIEEILEVIDNGTGMTQEIIEQNFLKVGSSRYQDSAFQREHPDFSPISRFGIGVLSTFMISDEVQVITCSMDEDSGREISLRSVHGQYLIRLVEKDAPTVPELIRQHGHGTLIRIRARRSADLANIFSVLKKWVVIPRAGISFQVDNGEEAIVGFSDLEAALLSMLKDRGDVDESGNLRTQWGDKVEVRGIKVKDIELAYAVTWNPYFNEWSFWAPSILLSDHRPGREAAEAQLGTAIEGIRVEIGTPGLRQGKIAAIANVTGKRAPRTNVARTALEKTAELDDFLVELYRAYCSHLIGEAAESVEKRGYSVTKAASEMSHLVRPIDAVSRGEGAGSDRLLRKALREIPALVRESDGARKLLSVSELEVTQDFITLDSPMIRRLEGLLVELPGSITLEDVVRLGDSAVIESWDTDMPRICGSVRGIFGELLRSEWEPAKINISSNGLLSVSWSEIGEEARWWSRESSVESLMSISDATLQLDAYAERIRDYNYFSSASGRVYVPHGEMSFEGTEDFDVVIVNDCLYLTPEGRLCNLPFRSSVSMPERYLFISSITKIVVSEERRRERYGVSPALNRDLIESIQSLDVSSVIDAEAFNEMTLYNPKVFDVSLWERTW